MVCCAFAAVLKPPRATKEVVYPSRSRRKQERWCRPEPLARGGDTVS